MKKNIALIVSIFTASIHGMETNFWTVTYRGTKINVNKGCISDVGDKVDAMVLGENQQMRDHSANVGEILERKSIANPPIAYRYKQDIGDVSDDDSYQPFPYPGEEKCCNFLKKSVNCLVFFVIEPCIRQGSNKVFLYSVNRPHQGRKEIYDCCLFEGDNAIKEATKDLIFCYKEAFVVVEKELIDEVEKSIAFAALSADTGFPREKAASIAVKTILEYIQNNPSAYDRVELFVTKRCEFAWYKLLLMDHCGLIYKICLLACAHISHCTNAYRDPEYPLSLLPRELIHYIANLI
jgi:hypothetical protein